MTNTIDLNKIRSLKTLEEMKTDLKEFLDFDRDSMIECYKEKHGWGVDDYEADVEQVKDLLEHVEKRAKSLGKFVARTAKAEKSPHQKETSTV